MTQAHIGTTTSPLSGTNFLDNILPPAMAAILSSHAGPSRPAYASASMLWVNNSTDPWILNMFDGTSTDIALGTISPASGKFTPSGVSFFGGTAAGTANAQTLAPAPALTTLPAGTSYDFIVANTNTAAGPTLKINALAAKTIKCSVGSGKVPAPIGALQSGMVASVVFDGTDFILLNMRPYTYASNMAAAATLNLDNAAGDYLHITGTTTITAITLNQGNQKTCVADGVFTMENDENLILQGGADITTNVGDIFIMRGEAGSKVRMVAYVPAGAMPMPDKVNTLGGGGGGTVNIDLNLGRSVKLTIDVATTTLAFLNPYAAGTEDIFTLQLTNGGSQTVIWPASVDWAGGEAPALTAAGVDELVFKTIDGGGTWFGAAILDVK